MGLFDFFRRKQVETKQIDVLTPQAVDLLDVLPKRSEVKESPTYLGAVNLLAGELARFKFVIQPDRFAKMFQNVVAPAKIINSEYEAIRYLYSKLLDTGRVAIILYDKTYILSADEFKLSYNKNNELNGIIVNDIKISLDRCFIVNLSDAKDGGYRDWLKDVIELECDIVQFMKSYAKSFGLFGAYKVSGDIDERGIMLLQTILAKARDKLQKGALPVLPQGIEQTTAKMEFGALNVIKDYIIKTIARMMGIPLLMLQAREEGAYALAKEERAQWYETTLRGLVELVRAGIENYLRRAYNETANVAVDFSDIEYLSDRRDWTTQEVINLYLGGVINEEESRRLLGLDKELAKQVEREQKSEEVAKESENNAEAEKTIQENKKRNSARSRRKERTKSILEEDEKVNWATIQRIVPLEKFATANILQDVKNAISLYVSEVKKSACGEIEKAADEIDPRDLNKDELTSRIVNAILGALKNPFKRSILRTLQFDYLQNDNVFIDAQKLIDAIPQMQAQLRTYIESETADRVANKLDELLQTEQRYSASDIIKELAKASVDKARAETIARTEINRACSFVHQTYGEELAKIAQDKNARLEKRWSTSLDEKVRQTHRDAGLQGWIPADEKFVNGLLHPYDLEGSADEVVNCRCRVLYRIVEV